MLSQTTEYALRAVTHLAGRQEPGFAGVKEIARATGVPVNYLAKILQRLAKANLLASQKGAGGGFRIDLPLNRVSVLDVVNAMEDTARMHKCMLGLRLCGGQENCPLHTKQIQYLQSLRTTTLQDVADFIQRQTA